LEDDDRAKYLFLSLLQARLGSSLVSHLGNLAPETVLQTPVVELAGRAKISERASRAIEELQRAVDPGRMQDRLAPNGIEALTPVDEACPGPLRSIPDPPPAVFVNGAVPDTASVALVGSRKASATGIEMARAFGLALSERGMCVVSGLARGVDAAAHEGRSRPGALLSAYSDVASTLPILQSTNGSELRFRALLSRGCAARLEIARA
jgi:DNA processing protein